METPGDPPTPADLLADVETMTDALWLLVDCRSPHGTWTEDAVTYLKDRGMPADTRVEAIEDGFNAAAERLREHLRREAS